MTYCKIVGHRGSSHDCPENTIVSFVNAWSSGADLVEGDFRLTSDNRVVCIHDDNLLRTAGVSLDVATSTLADIQDCDVGKWKSEQWTGQKVPSVEEFLDVVPDDKEVLLEVKVGPEILEPLAVAISNSKMSARRISIISFNIDVVKAVRDVLPDVSPVWLSSFKRDGLGFGRLSNSKVLSILDETDASGIGVRTHKCVDASFVNAVHEQGRTLNVWTVDDPEDAKRYIDIGVDSITTNRPKWIREMLSDILE